MQYEVKYKQSETKIWQGKLTEDAHCELIIKQLKGDTEYEFKIRGITDDGEEGHFSKVLILCHNSAISSQKIGQRTSFDKIR